jgi:Organic solvent tolerance protein OstA
MAQPDGCTCKGNVQVYFGKDRLSAKEAEFDIATKVGWLKDGEVFMEGPHAYFSGKRINKHWGDMYSFREAKITTCDGDVPAWSMSADEAIVEIDGYARLWNTSFKVKDQSVAYSPYMVVPAKKERQSGFLIPEVGYSRDNGAMLNIPFFLDVDKSQNLTLDADIMTKRGVMSEQNTGPAPTPTTSCGCGRTGCLIRKPAARKQKTALNAITNSVSGCAECMTAHSPTAAGG